MHCYNQNGYRNEYLEHYLIKLLIYQSSPNIHFYNQTDYRNEFYNQTDYRNDFYNQTDYRNEQMEQLFIKFITRVLNA